jgi:hypothetical protein
VKEWKEETEDEENLEETEGSVLRERNNQGRGNE